MIGSRDGDCLVRVVARPLEVAICDGHKCQRSVSVVDPFPAIDFRSEIKGIQIRLFCAGEIAKSGVDVPYICSPIQLSNHSSYVTGTLLSFE